MFGLKMHDVIVSLLPLKDRWIIGSVKNDWSLIKLIYILQLFIIKVSYF